MKPVEDLRDFLTAFISWASEQPDVQGIALVGSYARDAAREDSDIDLVILTDQPHNYLDDVRWIDRFGVAEKYQTEDYGKLTSLRVWYQMVQKWSMSMASPWLAHLLLKSRN